MKLKKFKSKGIKYCFISLKRIIKQNGKALSEKEHNIILTEQEAINLNRILSHTFNGREHMLSVRVVRQVNKLTGEETVEIPWRGLK